MDNVLIVVDDLEAAKAFFAELGMELEGEATNEGRWVDRVVGLDGVRADIAMVVWDHGGTPREIGDFGGVAWNTPMAVNEQGAVVGFANASAASGANLDPRAFIWTATGGLRQLDALPGDVTSQATGINEWGQVVGQSCDAAGNCKGVLWQNGVPAEIGRAHV